MLLLANPPPPPASSGISPRLRVWLALFAIGALAVAFDGGRDALRAKDAAPRQVSLAEAATLPDGTWVEVKGTVSAPSVAEVKGVLLSTGVFLFQLDDAAGAPPGIVLATNARRTPAFAGVSGDGWLVDKGRAIDKKVHAVADGGAAAPEVDSEREAAHAPNAELEAMLHAQRSFRGVLYRPGRQAGARHDEIEVDKERFKVDRYCNESAVSCTSDRVVLVVGDEPRPRLLSIAELFGALGAALCLAFLAATGGRRRAAAPPAAPPAPSRPQIAGERCATCRKNIVMEQDGDACEGCGCVFHRACASVHAEGCRPAA